MFTVTPIAHAFLLAAFAGAVGAHGFYRAGQLFGLGDFGFDGYGGGCCWPTVAAGAVDGALIQRAEVIGGF